MKDTRVLSLNVSLERHCFRLLESRFIPGNLTYRWTIVTRVYGEPYRAIVARWAVAL